MVTNWVQQLTASQIARERPLALFGLAVTRIGQLLCGIRGHDAVLHFEGRRVMMRCTSCGHDTPGWEVTDRGPRRRFEGDPGRHLLNPPSRLDTRDGTNRAKFT